MTCSAREGLCPLLYVLFFCIKVLQGKISLIFSCLTDQWCLSYMYIYKRQELEYTHILIQSYMYQLINSLMNLFDKRNCVKLCSLVVRLHRVFCFQFDIFHSISTHCRLKENFQKHLH